VDRFEQLATTEKNAKTRLVDAFSAGFRSSLPSLFIFPILIFNL